MAINSLFAFWDGARGASRVKRESWTPSISYSARDPVVLRPGGPTRRALSLRPGIGNSKSLEFPRGPCDVRFGSLADINASDEKGPLSGVKRTSPLATPVNESMT